MSDQEFTSVPAPLDETETVSPPVPRWRWAVALALLVFYVLGIGLIGTRQQQVAGTVVTEKEATLLPTTVEGLLRLSAGELVFFGGVFVIAVVFSRMRGEDLLLQWRGGLKPIFRGFGWSLFLRGVIAIVVTVIAVGVAGTSQDPHKTMEGLRPKTEAVVSAGALTADPIYLLLAMTLISFVVAGLREELWRVGVMRCLRGLFPQRFSSRKGQFVAVALAAIIFGLGHLPQGWSGAFITSILGLGLGILIVRYQSIWEAVLAHGFFNATTFLALYWIAKNHPAMLQ
jgi:membrane protease YdiL (CAAX protease family)